MISFLLGIFIGSVAGMLIMTLFIAGKQEEDRRVSILPKH
ncbi:MAG: DUF3789 domain-containing protein [Nitrospiraceae bacterium]|nr:MAG: DUF3789 domain-containing protein [Nitrospiraceae bacterium]